MRTLITILLVVVLLGTAGANEDFSDFGWNDGFIDYVSDYTDWQGDDSGWYGDEEGE